MITTPPFSIKILYLFSIKSFKKMSIRYDEPLCKVIIIQFVLVLVHTINDNDKMINHPPDLRNSDSGGGGGGGGGVNTGSSNSNHNKNNNEKFYFAIAATANGQQYSRVFNKTLINITQSYITSKKGGNYTFNLDTLVIELPESGSFSARMLTMICKQFEAKHIVGVLIVGDSPAAFTVSLTAKHAGIPVLWVREQGGLLPGFQSLETNRMEVHLAPSGRQLVQALRSLLLQAHWHTYTLLVDAASATVLRRPELWELLNTLPLHPTLIPLPITLSSHSLFRKLADISRSTRGVVILFSNRPWAVRVFEEAKRLNMMDGHFVWIWIDTVTNLTKENLTNYDSNNNNNNNLNSNNKDKFYNNIFDDRYKRSLVVKTDISDMQMSYLLKNDQFLLFNRNSGVESSKYNSDNQQQENYVSTASTITIATTTTTTTTTDSVPKGEFPVGILSLKPLPIRVDRHLVKGAVRLLISTLKIVLDQSIPWLIHSPARGPLMTSCWKPLGAREANFSSIFARELQTASIKALAGKKYSQEIGVDKVDKSLIANFEILNLVPESSTKDNSGDSIMNGSTNHEQIMKITTTTTTNLRWKRVGMVSGRIVRLDTIIWPGGDLSVAAVSSRARTVFRVVTALAPPFVMESELDEDGQCLRGLPCHRVLTSDKDNLTLVFNEMQRLEDEDADDDNAVDFSNLEYKQQTSNFHSNKNNNNDNNNNNFNDNNSNNNNNNNVDDNDDYEDRERFFPFHNKFKYRTNCCYGLAMDLLENVAQELEFDFRLYIVADGFFGSKSTKRDRYHRYHHHHHHHYHQKYNHNNQRQERDIRYTGYRYKNDINLEITDEDDGEEDENSNDDDATTTKWNGIVGDLVSGAAHMSFAALSVSSARSEVIDFSVPYFFSGVSLLVAPQQTSEIPLMAFLLPFSPELWIAIFTSLNITAIAVAIYEWLSPFGLNPWGRQRSKNFSMSSALWVMWGLLCGHLVAFKAPKSWPNKFLINVWGGFSVIFVASYTANIAALIAGLFFHNTVNNYRDSSLLSQRVGAPRHSAAEYYVQKANRILWEHMKKYSLENIEEGIDRLRNGSLDVLIADTPVLDYYRATDHGCKLQKFGDVINQDTYAIGMTKGFPLKDSISAVIAKYSSNGYMDILQEKWYGGLPCFKLATDIVQPRPLGVAAVTGVFILLGVGIALGLLILLVEHLFFRYTLPLLRNKPKGSMWRSRNIMFFSQKLYRFINCVELVSPHHAARELVHTLRQGQITSLFQKSIKRKEHEQRRRRKSKAQFFEMIQEIRSTIRRQQQEEREAPLEPLTEVDNENQINQEDHNSRKSTTRLSPSILRRTFMKTSPKAEISKSKQQYLTTKQMSSPRAKNKEKNFSTLNVRRFSTDSVMNSSTMRSDSNIVGRRLSRDANSFLTSSPPDMNSRRSSYLDIIDNKLSGKSPVLSIENVSECSSRSPSESLRKLSDSESIGRKLATLPKYREPIDRKKLQPQYSLTLGKSDETLMKQSQIQGASSYNNVSTANNLSDDEIARRNKSTIKQLQTHLNERQTDNNAKSCNTNPQIRIHVEDTTATTTGAETSDDCRKKSPQRQPLHRRRKTRHQSLGDSFDGNQPQYNKKHEQTKSLQQQSKSFDCGGGGSSSQRQKFGIDLPPAPPPPNCSPRNSNGGRSPLERLSKDELVQLWRSSESELRSHLLKAIREKGEDDQVKPP